jgi:oligopeptide transport system ATP-binding protein
MTGDAAPAPAAGPTTAAPLLEGRNINVHFPVARSMGATLGRRDPMVLRAVDGVDLEVQRGESLALVGESGSGKSTLARVLVGVEPVHTGELRFGGEVLTAKRTRAQRRQIQMVFQDPYSSLNPRIPVGRMLRELLLVHRVVEKAQVDEAITELLARVGLGDDVRGAYPRQFSGGQRQRLAIARALALRPELLVADEPVSALDVSVQATILNLLHDLQRDLGLTLLFIAHNLSVVRHLCDRVAVMYLGRIVEVAPTEELFTNPRHPYTKGLLQAIPRLTPGRGSTAVALQGDPPSPLRVPSGCRFHPRCPYAAPVCEREDPQLATDQPLAVAFGEHRAACHFAWVDPPAAHAPEVELDGAFRP